LERNDHSLFEDVISAFLTKDEENYENFRTVVPPSEIRGRNQTKVRRDTSVLIYSLLVSLLRHVPWGTRNTVKHRMAHAQ
jgi:hypothetical protein